MKLFVCGIKASAAEFEEVPTAKLEVGCLYLCRIPNYDDEGNETVNTDTCWVIDSKAKNINGTVRKLVKFTCQPDAQFFLSQLPMCKFFGPLHFEWEGA